MGERTIETPLGRWTVKEEDGAIISLRWGGALADDESPLLTEACAQLSAYAAGDLREFDLPLAPAGGSLIQAVLKEMRAIPFGETVTYGEIAAKTGAPAQAVGQACGANPISVIIPCHRVTGSAGLGGFSAPGGVESKVALLRHEGAYSLLI